MPKKQSNPFGMALAARRGDIPPEMLKGSAKHLFKREDLTEADLGTYVKSQKGTAPPKKPFGQVHRTWKRG